VTDRSLDADEPHLNEVRRSLRALADGSVAPRDSTDEPAATAAASARSMSLVDGAERAVRSAREAASFLSAGRLTELDEAIAVAAHRGDDDVAARGRAARESLRRLDAALSGAKASEPAADVDPAGSRWEPHPADADSNRGVDPAGSSGPPRERDDHFHSGRGTVLRDTAQDPSR